MNWIKYFAIMIVFLIVIIVAGYVSFKHQLNVTSTQNVGLGLSTLNVGEARESLSSTMNREALEANLLLHIAEEQKEHNYDTRISYVFLDNEGNITSELDDVKSVQYQVELLGENGKTISTTRERIEVHSLLE